MIKKYRCRLNHETFRTHLNYVTGKLGCGRHHCCAPVYSIVTENGGRIRGQSQPHGFNKYETPFVENTATGLYWDTVRTTKTKTTSGVTIAWEGVSYDRNN